MQRQQLAAIQQQQAQQQRSWTAQKSMMNPQAGAPSLLEIQQEQARQLEEKHRQQQQQVQQTKAKVRECYVNFLRFSSLAKKVLKILNMCKISQTSCLKNG